MTRREVKLNYGKCKPEDINRHCYQLVKDKIFFESYNKNMIFSVLVLLIDIRINQYWDLSIAFSYNDFLFH